MDRKRPTRGSGGRQGVPGEGKQPQENIERAPNLVYFGGAKSVFDLVNLPRHKLPQILLLFSVLAPFSK